MRKVLFPVICLTFFLVGCAQKTEKVETPIEPAQEMLNETTAEVSAAKPQVSAPATAPAAVTEPAAPVSTVLSEAMIPEKPTNEDIQKALKNAGFYEGKIDGNIGPKSKKAIEAFQAKNGLTADGKVGPKTWEKMKQYLAAQAAPAQAATTTQQ